MRQTCPDISRPWTFDCIWPRRTFIYLTQRHHMWCVFLPLSLLLSVPSPSLNEDGSGWMRIVTPCRSSRSSVHRLLYVYPRRLLPFSLGRSLAIPPVSSCQWIWCKLMQINVIRHRCSLLPPFIIDQDSNLTTIVY